MSWKNRKKKRKAITGNAKQREEIVEREDKKKKAKKKRNKGKRKSKILEAEVDVKKRKKEGKEVMKDNE